ncbi:unnamed protein product [Effrenium voratum]|uniref:Uncharacterized protein n=1 Tax=Effrenium voratum TaxID=2562239 RepID=A0AA36N876_9DINO|nr:unnamed protein product [Effrenium voratum]
MEQLVGPAGKGRSGWTSALLELNPTRSGGSFSLELWRFWEQFQEPISLSTGTFETKARRSVCREDVRVALSGHYKLTEVPAVRLAGFCEAGLNQAFALATGLTVSGLPTWWSEDGQYFMYYAEQYQHWKVNGLRAVGGDGLAAVGPGKKRAGCGFAHSGQADGRSPAGLLQAAGWFEVDDGEWLSVTPSTFSSRAWSFRFQAEKGSTEESAALGDVRAASSGSGSAAFCGLRHSKALLLFLPPKPGSEAAQDCLIAQDGATALDDQLMKETGEPEVMTLQPPKSKL